MNFLQHCSLWKNLVISLLEPFLRNCLKVSKIVLEETGDICRENCKDRWHSPYSSMGMQKWNCYWLMYNLLLTLAPSTKKECGKNDNYFTRPLGWLLATTVQYIFSCIEQTEKKISRYKAYIWNNAEKPTQLR